MHPFVRRGERTYGLCYIDIIPIGNGKEEGSSFLSSSKRIESIILCPHICTW